MEALQSVLLTNMILLSIFVLQFIIILVLVWKFCKRTDDDGGLMITWHVCLYVCSLQTGHSNSTYVRNTFANVTRLFVLKQECDSSRTPSMTSAMWGYMEASYEELQALQQQQRTLSIKVMMLIAKVRGAPLMVFVSCQQITFKLNSVLNTLTTLCGGIVCTRLLLLQKQTNCYGVILNFNVFADQDKQHKRLLAEHRKLLLRVDAHLARTGKGHGRIMRKQ